MVVAPVVIAPTTAPVAAPVATAVAAPVAAESDDGDDDATVVVKDDDAKVKIVVKSDDDDDDDDDEEIVEEVIEVDHHHHQDYRWAGLSVGTIFSPVPSNGQIGEGVGRLNSNKFRACLEPKVGGTCGYVKGFDFKVQMFETGGSRDYPTVIGYFRTGFTAGRVDVDPGSNDFLPGQVTSMRYTSVPLFFGGNIYAFGDFPIRPYAGLGMGFDVLRLDYRRNGESRFLDASGRFGFELHAGLEARISNFVAFHAEVMQLWSVRRKVADMPDMSNTGLSVLAGVSVAIPTNLRDYREHHHHEVRRTRTVKKR